MKELWGSPGRINDLQTDGHSQNAFFSWSPPLSAADIYIWRDTWKNVPLGVWSPRELWDFAGVHQCSKQAMDREEEEEEKGSVGTLGREDH